MTERENALHALRHDGKARWVPLFSKAVCVPDVSLNRDKIREGRDWFGVEWRDYTPTATRLFDDITRWEEFVRFPDLDAMDWAAEAARLEPSIDRENRVVWMSMSQGLFERMHSLVGFENALLSFYTEPEAAAALIGALAEFRFRLTEKLLDWFDPDVVNYRDDYGSQLNLLFHPDVFRRFFKPHIRRLAEQAHARGKLFVLHSCGKVDALIGDFVELGADAWDSVQPCCDLAQIYRDWGERLSFASSLDLVLFAKCGEARARQNVRETIDLLGGHRGLLLYDRFPISLPLDESVITEETERCGRYE